MALDGIIRKAKKALICPACANPLPESRNGYPFLSQGAMAFSPEAWSEIRRGLRLPKHELQIIQGVFDDKLEYWIAAELGISVNTIHTELRRLRHKLQAADQVSLVLRVVEEFLRQTTSDQTTLPAICRNHSNRDCPLLRAVSRA